MTQLLKAVATLLLTAVIPGAALAAGNSSDVRDIEALLNNNYLKGFYHDLDAGVIQPGFHPEMRLAVLDTGETIYVPLADWMAHEGVGLRPEELTAEQKAKAGARLEILSIDVEGDAAAAKARVYIGDQLVYTNFYGLYRNSGGWLVVNKLFSDHVH